MTILSNRILRMKPSATVAMNDLFHSLVHQGKDVINLGVGEPDKDTPVHIKNAAIRAINDGETNYTPVKGTLACRLAVAEKFERDNELIYKPEEIIVTPGGKQVIFNALMASVNPYDEVIIPAPYWVSYPSMVELFDGKPVFVECFEEDDFKLTPESLEAAITSKTKWLIINGPSNPTGAVYSYDEMKALTNVLLKYPHVWVMTDDVYEPLVFDQPKFFTPAQVEPRLLGRTLTVNGVSKAYAMTGWRIGYAGGPLELINGMAKAQGQINTHASSVSQGASVEALRGDQSILQEWNNIFRERRDVVVKMLNEIDGVSCKTPGGAFYVFPSCSAHIGKSISGEMDSVIRNDGDFVMGMLRKAFVSCVSGSAFGGPDHFRVSYATSHENLLKACDRMNDFCAKLKP